MFLSSVSWCVENQDLNPDLHTLLLTLVQHSSLPPIPCCLLGVILIFFDYFLFCFYHQGLLSLFILCKFREGFASYKVSSACCLTVLPERWRGKADFWRRELGCGGLLGLPTDTLML